MGVKDLPKRLRDDRKAVNNLEELRGIFCGQYLSVILHQLYRKQDFAWSFHAIPSVDLYVHVEKHLNMLKAVYDKAGVTMILYADRFANLGKAAEDAQRSQHRKKKRAKFRSLQRPVEGDPNPSDKEEITQLMKETCYIRQDVLFNVKTCVVILTDIFFGRWLLC